MPKEMDYTTQAIICLASDLRESAEALQGKRVAAGDATGIVNEVNQWRSTVSYYPMLALPNLFTNSRLIIIGHGDAGSSYIMGDGIQWDAKELARRARGWIHTKINRISLHMCFGGGNRGTGGGANFGNFQIHPGRSFAFKFASYCDFAQSVTARTERTNMVTSTTNGVLVTARREVGAPGAKRHHGIGDKVVFLPNGGTLDAPVDPRMQY